MSAPIRQSSRLLIHEPALQVLPSLACVLGLNEAILLQQIHYWIIRPEAHERDGRRWVYNSYPDWQKQFPFWSVNTIRRAIETLEKRGILLSANYNASAIDRTKWYTIDYEALDALEVTPPPSGKRPRPSAQNEQTNSPTWADDQPDMGRPIPETNTETNTEMDGARAAPTPPPVRNIATPAPKAEFDTNAVWDLVTEQQGYAPIWDYKTEAAVVKRLHRQFPGAQPADFARFLGYVGTCYPYSVDTTLQPTFSKGQGHFGKWWTGGRPVAYRPPDQLFQPNGKAPPAGGRPYRLVRREDSA